MQVGGKGYGRRRPIKEEELHLRRLCLCDNLQEKDEGGELPLQPIEPSIPEAPSVRPIRLNNHRDAL